MPSRQPAPMKKWDIFMKVTGWVRVGEIEAESRDIAEKNLHEDGNIDEDRVHPFESHLEDLLEREGVFEVEEQ